MMRDLFKKEGTKQISGKILTDDKLEILANKAPANAFYSFIGVEYKALDTDGWY
jgi:hypothetical protein